MENKKPKVSFEEELERKGTLVYTNVGVSMMPLLRQRRDLMILRKKEKTERCRKYDAVMYKRPNGQYVLHRILKVEEQNYVICGDNCYQKEYGIKEEQILAILTGVVRDGREISVTNKWYLLYVHIWCDFFPIRAGILRGKVMLGKIARRILKRKKR